MNLLICACVLTVFFFLGLVAHLLRGIKIKTQLFEFEASPEGELSSVAEEMASATAEAVVQEQKKNQDVV